MTMHPDTETTDARDATENGDELETPESVQVSRIKRYDQRVEEWLASMKDEAEQRSPEVLRTLAAKAQDVADYLNKAADKAKVKSQASPVVSSEGISAHDESGNPIENKETK